MILDQRYQSPLLRDPNDLDVMQTAERGEADILCSNDSDFHEPGIVLSYAALGIEGAQ
jgi:predicted nuclease of predicted toxin-antitoxin system